MIFFQEHELKAEFWVVQVNWYYRRQSRVLQFFERIFRRINPINNTVRAVRPYSDIKSFLWEAEKDSLTITYSDHSKDFFETTQGQAITEILKAKTTTTTERKKAEK